MKQVCAIHAFSRLVFEEDKMSKRGIPQSELEFNNESLKGRPSTVGAGGVEPIMSIGTVAALLITMLVGFGLAMLYVAS